MPMDIPAGAPAPAPPPIAPAPSRTSDLVGESSQAVLTWFGEPSLRRDEGSAEFWLYETKSGCRINVVLYREGDGEHVAHADARLPPRVSEAACLRSLAMDNGREPAS